MSDTEIIRYRTCGSGPIRLVLVHGLAARAESWTDLVPLLPPDRYTVYLVDLLGSGESSKPKGADYSIRAHAVRLLEFIERELPSAATVAGHSLGGAVVLMAAIEARRMVKEHLLRSIIIIAGPGFIQRLPLMAEVFRSRLAATLFVLLYAPDAWVRIGLRAAYYDERLVDREHVSRYAPCYRDRDAKRALVQTCRRLIPPDADDIIPLYASLRLPVLLLWGRHDRIVPLSQGERLQDAIPGAKLEVIEECGHNPQEEKPVETFTIIDRFISQGSSGSIQE
ncbi:alpha/beta fold hydrolase [Geobacter sp. DSM 9736]|uniref:alpha/beta fold hydrolase n=1 Tax=Geobacter sp. DSM 9736 TaxID=1277350 RepID=UPI001E64781E|nr:alpha/beta hydrolase [Geobacter sp. DSM 9736]